MSETVTHLGIPGVMVMVMVMVLARGCTCGVSVYACIDYTP